MLEVRSVTKNFGDLTAVDAVSFTASPGQVYGLIGPNGAGKSTIIRMIMNILAPDTGKILFDGRPVREEDKSRIGYLPEERGLYKKVKLGEMLWYLADLKGADLKQGKENIDRWLERFELTEWKERKIEELSKGMTQKAQFIAAVAHDPEMMFFDEPFSGLDPVSTDMLRESIVEMGNRGKTVLFSTHNMESAERICSNIFMINKGREVISGGMSHIKDFYGSRSVILEFDGSADFISDLPEVEKMIRYPRWVEIELADDSSPDKLLAKLTGRISIRRFEVASPSLHKIFVDLVGKQPEEVEDE
jgi:ABC-2 type transport system ATP-binding protein